jgi:hypothetical protein
LWHLLDWSCCMVQCQNGFGLLPFCWTCPWCKQQKVYIYQVPHPTMWHALTQARREQLSKHGDDAAPGQRKTRSRSNSTLRPVTLDAPGEKKTGIIQKAQ